MSLYASSRNYSEPSPLCAHCGERPATCVGRYDAMTKDEPACDECCGHGCEDGRCVQFERKEEEESKR